MLSLTFSDLFFRLCQFIPFVPYSMTKHSNCLWRLRLMLANQIVNLWFTDYIPYAACLTTCFPFPCRLTATERSECNFPVQFLWMSLDSHPLLLLFSFFLLLKCVNPVQRCCCFVDVIAIRCNEHKGQMFFPNSRIAWCFIFYPIRSHWIVTQGTKDSDRENFI